MSDRKLTSGEISMLHLVLILALTFSAYTWLHGYRWRSDYELESKIIESLVNIKYYIPGSELMASDVVCFLPSYSLANSISINLLDKERLKLNSKINSLIGSGDHVWWIVGVKNGAVEYLFRMSGKIRPNIKSAKCVNAESFFLNFQSMTKYTIFFNINTKE